MALGLIDVLKVLGFDPSLRTKLVRHQDSRYPVEELRRHGWLELYQSYQSNPRFHGLDQFVSFYALSGTRAGFYGVYRVGAIKSGRKGLVDSRCPWSREWNRSATHFYELERDQRFDELSDRLVIEWGAGTRSWVQRLSNKTVLEVQEPGRRLPPFDDYLEFTLTFAELKDLFASEEAHRDWRAQLSAVSGVYLILAETTGHQYVGSASGTGGIWGRWRAYANSGHGGNALLRDLIARDGDYPERLRFSVLHILPRTITRDQVIKREAIYKAKLGSRATGLNLN